MVTRRVREDDRGSSYTSLPFGSGALGGNHEVSELGSGVPLLMVLAVASRTSGHGARSQLTNIS